MRFDFGLLVLVGAGWLCSAAGAHETDQYSVPLGREMADLRLHFAAQTYDQLSDVVESLNHDIERTLEDGRPTAATLRYYEQDTIARSMLLEFPPVMFFIELYEIGLREHSVVSEYPGYLVTYRPVFWIYHHWSLVFNPTKITRQKRCSTVMVDGTYFGMDKLAHFAHMGYIYYTTFSRARGQGADEAEAVRKAVGTATGANLFFSENALLGRITTGVRSNGDLASNYTGFKFYRNLTEPVMLRGEMRPPMLVRDGVYWRINDHVRPNNDFFTWFISDHWDEALNPNTYNIGVGGAIRSEIRKRCNQVLDWYRGRDGRPRSREEFLQVARSLETYYGEDYGHCGETDSLVQIANSCFEDNGEVIKNVWENGREELAPADGSAESPRTPADRLRLLTSDGQNRPKLPPHQVAAADRDQRDRLGRTRLWWAIYNNDVEEARRLISRGANVNAADIDGETPLHCAARWGRLEAVKLLLWRGADAKSAARSGATPLHLAVREHRGDVVELLLASGAAASATDTFGCTPLHDAAARGNLLITETLLKSGADPRLADSNGTTALHRAARGGHGPVVSALMAAGADATAKNLVGRTPHDEAMRGKFDAVAAALQPSALHRAGAPAARPSTDSGDVTAAKHRAQTE